MLVLIGILIVTLAVCVGYVMAHGEFALLYQPAEFVIIWGAALGALVMATPWNVLRRIGRDVAGVVRQSPYGNERYLKTLRMFYDIFHEARKNGMMGLEKDAERPNESAIFQRYPEMLADKKALAFVCDTLRMAIAGGATSFDLEQMIDTDLEALYEHNDDPVRSLMTTADALPGLGIVAAVLGIVVAMSALGGPPDELGRKVAAALVGTFLGVLTSYGFVAPLANAISSRHAAELAYFRFLKHGLIAFVKGHPPLLAVEMGRRSIPLDVRPTFGEMEDACRTGLA